MPLIPFSAREDKETRTAALPACVRVPVNRLHYLCHGRRLSQLRTRLLPCYSVRWFLISGTELHLEDLPDQLRLLRAIDSRLRAKILCVWDRSTRLHSLNQ